MKKAKIVRKTLAEKLTEARAEAHMEGYQNGFNVGAAEARREFAPPYDARSGLRDFVRIVESWPLADDALVAIVATDLKHVCNVAIPARVMQTIASEMKKRLA